MMDLYHSTDPDGVSILNPDSHQMLELLKALDDPDSADRDHPDVSLVHDQSGWSISVFPGGTVTFENLNDPDENVRFMRNVSRQAALQLWVDLSKGKISRIKAQAWSDGDDVDH